MSPRPRFKETPVDEEKIKHFSKKFEEQGVFDDAGSDGSSQETMDDPKLKSVLSKFSEFDDPPEEKKSRNQMKKEEKKAEEKQTSTKEAVPSSPEKVVVHEPHPTFRKEEPAQQAAAQSRLTKAEAYAVQQYQAKLSEQKRSGAWHAIKIGFFFGIGLLLFALLIAIILFSAAVAMNVTVPELLQMLI